VLKKLQAIWQELKRPVELSFIFALALCAYVFLFMLSKVDAFLTLNCLYQNECIELNPIVDWSIKISPVFFLLFKSALVGTFGGILFLLCVVKKSKSAFWALALLLLFYLAIVFYHLMAV